VEDDLAIISAVTLYKIFCLAVGSLFCWLGYRLFTLGVWGHAGDFDAKFKSTKLVLKSAAPGTFFAVLGAAIVIVTLWQGLHFDLHLPDPSTTLAGKSPPSLPDADGASK
jgi:hypothetical protein